ncbi:MAG: hypothetical protein ACC661_09190, partial [Verrucomicrobiales bacterium]
LIETLDATYSADLTKLYNAPKEQPTPVAGLAVSISGNTLTVDPPAGFTGTFTVRVTASDGVASAKREFSVTVT